MDNLDYDHMVYVRLFEGCNLACEHCFIPANPKKIDPSFYANNGLTETLKKEASIKEGSSLYIQWHGGEPTLLGPQYLEEAILAVENDKRFKYIHGIQTNLINFDQNPDEWERIYKTYFNGHVGISWDPQIRHIKRKEKNEETNRQFEEKFWNNVKMAQERGLTLYMVITATKLFFNQYEDPFEFYDFISEKGIKALNFERVTNTGEARITWNKLGLSNKEYSENMAKFFKAYVLFKDNNEDTILNISPFDGLLESVLQLKKNNGELPEVNDIEESSNFAKTVVRANVWDILSFKNQGYGCWSGQCDTRFHTIDSNGYKHGCTALTSEQDNKNKDLKESLSSKKIIWIGSSAKEQKDNILKVRASRQENCVECRYLSICSSGCLSVEKFDASNECFGAKELFKAIDWTIDVSISAKASI